ncbi:MAG: hypothetical protein J6X12_04360 [Paludibacteraceae bacterium]|nr:hypothetical protein [Paludibacteraceae bacterium]
MLKKVIKYTDYNGVEREEPFYFNLSKAELVELEMSVNGGLTEFITRVVATQDQTELIKLFKRFILMAYGEKSDDGKRFIKSEEISANFAATEAYSELFMELMSSTEKMTEFVNALAPAGVSVNEAEAKKFIEDKMK